MQILNNNFFSNFLNKKLFSCTVGLVLIFITSSSCKKTNVSAELQSSNQAIGIQKNNLTDNQKPIGNSNCTTLNPMTGPGFPFVGEGLYTGNIGGVTINVTHLVFRINYVCNDITYYISFPNALGWEASGEISCAPGSGAHIASSNGTEFVISYIIGQTVTVNWNDYNNAKIAYENNPFTSPVPNLSDYSTASGGGQGIISAKLIRTNFGSGFAIVSTCYPYKFVNCNFAI